MYLKRASVTTSSLALFASVGTCGSAGEAPLLLLLAQSAASLELMMGSTALVAEEIKTKP